MYNKELQPRRECVVLLKRCKSRKSPKARKIPFPCGDQERFRKSGSYRDGGWCKDAFWGAGTAWTDAWRWKASSFNGELSRTVRLPLGVCKRQQWERRLEGRKSLEFKAKDVVLHSYRVRRNWRLEQGNGLLKFVQLEDKSRRMQEDDLWDPSNNSGMRCKGFI